MKYLKLNSVQAKKLAGMYDRFNALDPVFVGIDDSTGEEEFILQSIERLGNVFGIAKRYLQKQADDDKIKIVDTIINPTDPDVIKLNAISKETDVEIDARINSRVTKWDYTKIEIKKEL